MSVALTRNSRWSLPVLSRAGKGLLVVGFAAGVLLTPGLLTYSSLISVLDYAAPIGLVALGMMFVTLSGKVVSLSLGASVSIAGLTFLAATSTGNVWLAALAALVVGVLVNAVQGLVIGFLKANSIITSIAALTLITGITTQITGGAAVFPEPGVPLDMFRMRFAGINVLILTFVAATIFAECVLRCTVFGRMVYLVGANQRAAEVAGIRVPLVVTAAYALAGLFCAVAGILMASRLQMASMETGIGYDYDAVTAVLIGGTAMHGGKGSAWQTFVGTLLLSTFTIMLILNGASQEVQRVLIGLLVLAVICLNAPREQQ